MTPTYAPLFRCPLFPNVEMRQGLAFAQFRVPTSWQVQRPARPGVVGVPQRFDSLLAHENLFFSVLPFGLRHQHRIHVTSLAHPAPPWIVNDNQGGRHTIPCDFGRAEVWLPHVNQQTTWRLPLLVLLPRAAAPEEPTYPLIGQEFLRHYSPRVMLDFPSFPFAPGASLTQPVGSLDWL